VIININTEGGTKVKKYIMTVLVFILFLGLNLPSFAQFTPEEIEARELGKWNRELKFHRIIWRVGASKNI